MSRKKEDHPYVSRGGIKLAGALDQFAISVIGRTALDIGASTGGFTDCLLQRGAARVWAIDVAYGQFAWKLRQDPRVVTVERTNVRYLTREKLYQSSQGQNEPANFAVIDLSFISLGKVMPAVYNLLADHAEVVALIKPQFEARREQVERGGIVRDEKVREEVVNRVKGEAEAAGFKVKRVIKSPIEGADGNVEFLIHLVK
ncbi:MAG: TlyA family RNA methyltransferase [Candidatus Margulisbacteria bacterium]|nr:TlyA family RNA methyltransferase [Candidatus Margulisiibacteriota bacterium]MBU1617170.1 TlyA family RNA methyltransferase [Candidatus Margulisiibacteriota bacterium]MBU1867334.1 TlyA family RNA methyltransferase [Candidatus Margulisiibacteriota bacterium]